MYSSVSVLGLDLLLLSWAWRAVAHTALLISKTAHLI